MSSSGSSNLRIFILLIVFGIFGIITFILAAATLGTVNKRFNRIDENVIPKSFPVKPKSELSKSIKIEDLMNHLKELENIALSHSNTRTIGTPGFERTLDYIENVLRKETNFKIYREKFSMRNFSIDGRPEFSWSQGGQPEESLNYSTNFAESDFAVANFSVASLGNESLEIFVVNNSGCRGADWSNATGKAALVIAGGECTYAEKGELATKYNAAAIVYYNNGATTSNLAPVIIRLRQRNTLPAVVLSYRIGKRLRQLASDPNNSIKIKIKITLMNYPNIILENLFAETDESETTGIISIGSHSDSVPEGPGINDNGSGSSANLVLATNLARLYSNKEISVYPYQIRFSWWGAEEFGLIGSIDHVLSTPDNKLFNYLVNLNFDMLGSPNYMFGVYDANQSNPETPGKVIPGSLKITKAFQDWFRDRKLPFTNTEFSGRSDYGPFLQNGIVAGGLFSGADGRKSINEYREYRSKLKTAGNSLMNAIHDPCYHQPCDNTDNIDQFAFLTMVQAAADIIDFLGRQKNLRGFLYPS